MFNQLIPYGLVVISTVAISRSLSPPLITQTQSVTPSSVTLQEIQKLGELTTIRLPVQVIVPAIATREIMGIPQQTKVLYVAQVHITAGVDVQQATLEDGAIVLPAAKILDAKVDVAKSSVFDSSKDWLAPDVAIDLLAQAQKEALQTGVVTACNTGVLRQAEAQTKLVLGKLVGGEVAIAPIKECRYADPR